MLHFVFRIGIKDQNHKQKSQVYKKETETTYF